MGPRRSGKPRRATVTRASPSSTGNEVKGSGPLSRAGQAAEMRARLATFAADWDSPEMAIYDDYDAAKLHPR